MLKKLTKLLEFLLYTLNCSKSLHSPSRYIRKRKDFFNSQNIFNLGILV